MIELIAPGDVYVADYETLQFHREMSYTIRNVYHINGKLIATIIDKWGNEVFFIRHKFKITAKTHAAQMLRHLKAMLESWWNMNGTLMDWRGWNKDKPSVFYKVNTSTYISGKYPNGNTSANVVTDYKFRDDIKTPWYHIGNSTRKEYETKKECIDFFFDLYKKTYQDNYYSLRLEDLTVDHQDHQNLQTYILMNGINTMPEAEQQRLLAIKMDDGGRHTEQCNYEFDKFMSFLNELIFDKKITDAEVKEHVKTIVGLFMVIPGSWAATACANVLLGKGKVKNSSTEPFWEKFSTLGLKMPQVFAFVDHVDSFMWEQGIFKKKEDYSKEHRGVIEYIGSKYIDKDKLQEFLK